ncbi:MAG: GH3 auxin-responsive promoter family protein [Saprospiraceae bacterium]|nr:GH3 auxin-responsive promoter family protein [Lewinella sp.]
MSIIGNVIKTAIEIKSTLTPEIKDAYETQEEQLRKLLSKASETAFGKYYNFDKILESENPIATFRQTVPIHDYDLINNDWWQQQQDQPDITWPGQPKYFALSSGTTGKASKRIPVTDEMLACFRAVGISQVESLTNFDFPAAFFEKDVLMLSSSADLEKHKDHLEGEISGINTSNLPFWFNGFYKPGIEIARIPNWDERVAAIAEAAPEWDIVALAGIPSWIQMMLEKIIERHQLENIHELWPNLRVYASGGVAFKPYRESLEKLMGRPLIYMDTYLASEGFFAFTARPDTMNMKLALKHDIYYEFIPFDERGFDETGTILEEPEVHSIEQVQKDQDYALLVSTPAGAWRYMIGDTVKFTDLDNYEIRISGRTKYFLNVVGSQLSEEKINNAVQQLAERRQVDINEFAVAAVKDDAGDYIHQWVLGTKNELDEEEAARALDEILQDLNKNYKVARNKALKAVQVRAVSSQKVYDWLESRKKKGGQIKMPKVMKEEMMVDLLEYLE